MRKSLICMLLLVSTIFVGYPITQTTQATPDGFQHAWAVIVCATTDGLDETKFLYQTLISNYNFSDIYYLSVDTSQMGVDAKMTKANVRSAFTDWLAQRSDENDLVFVFLVSHGAGYNLMNIRQLGLLPKQKGGQCEVSWDDQGKVSYSDEGNETLESDLWTWYYNKTSEQLEHDMVDVNGDGDFNDWIGVDEVLGLNAASGYWNPVEPYTDDELATDLSEIQCSTMIVALTSCERLNNDTDWSLNYENYSENCSIIEYGCFSGGYIDDLSAPNRIIMSISNETGPGWGPGDKKTTFWGDEFISALGDHKTLADMNADGKVSIKEAFDYAVVNDYAAQSDPKIETPWLDDNGNGLPTYKNGLEILDPTDGTLASQTFLPPSNDFTGLRGYWNLDEGNGATVKDSSIFNNTGTLRGSPLWTNGKYGEALSFDGTDDFVQVGMQTLAKNELTVAAWVKPEKPAVSFKNKAVTRLGDFTFSPWHNRDLRNVCFEVCLGNDIGWITCLSDPNAVDWGVWQHFACTYDGSYMRIYKNGQLIKTKAQTGPILGLNRALYIGAMIAVDPQYTNYYNGSVDEVLIFNQALSADAIGCLASSVYAPSQLEIRAVVLPVGTLETDAYLDGWYIGTTSHIITVKTVDPHHTLYLPEKMDVELGKKYGFAYWEDNSTANPRNITVSSQLEVTAYFRHTSIADIDSDGHVGYYDLGYFANAYRRKLGDQRYDPRCDFDCDKDVDKFDLGTFAQYYRSS